MGTFFSCSKMVKHNNIIPNQHFRKDWQRYVKTWFDQPAKKVARRQARDARAKKVAPRPLGLLRPVVHCTTNKYNMKVRAGRGFTLLELKRAGISKHEALGIGIAVDHRRKNRSDESLKANVERLKLYKSKLVVFPRKMNSKRTKKGDATAKQMAAVSQVRASNPIPIVQPKPVLEVRKITKQEKEQQVTKILRKALTDYKREGARAQLAKVRAEALAAKSKKK